ncbi:MAG: cyclodeaminase/cyclohydrolase family protein [Elusimicrobiota bacterium]
MSDHINKSLQDYINDVSSQKSTPGGGNVVGVVSSFGCALMLMSIRIGVLAKEPDSRLERDSEEELLKLRQEFIILSERDSKKFKQVIKNWKKRGEELENALKGAAEVSLEMAELNVKLIDLIEKQNLERLRNIVTDVGISLELARACFNGGIMNYKVNKKAVKKQDTIEKLELKSRELIKKFNEKYGKISEKIGRLC